MEMNGLGNRALWIGIAAGAAVGIGIALSRRKRTRWESAREVGQRVARSGSDLGAAARDLITRVKGVYEEGLKIAEDAGELWEHGRRLVRAR
jgi:hypothetical protein